VIRLVLFDIDGTLLLTGGAGGRAMSRAFLEVFGVPAGPALPFAGRTDAWILAQLAARHGIALDADARERFRTSYLTCLAQEIRQPGPRKGVMPGVCRLLDALAAREDVHLALLTGNFAAGARLKLEYFDLWRYFSCGAYGDEVHDRTELLAPALAEVEACGLPVPPRQDIVVVGDTPLDVAVATAGGARSVGVSTGGYDVHALKASGADVALEDFSDLDASLNALGFGRGL
jgi:phosphoglycolate phosphatase-like HAD superfamily hydrolase